MNLRDHKIIVKIKSILDYGLPLFMDENEQVNNKLESAYMTINRIIHGGYTYKVNKVKICSEIESDLPGQHMNKTAVLYLHKHLNHRKCPSLMDQLLIPKQKRLPYMLSDLKMAHIWHLLIKL